MSSELSVPQIMKEYADDAVGFTRDNYQIDLDYSEASLGQVEQILGKLHRELPDTPDDQFSKQGLSRDEFIHILCHMFGGYIGEIVRQRYGGEWKTETIASEQPMVTLKIGSTFVFPPSKVYKRLTNGPGDDVEFYYAALKQKIEEGIE